MVDDSHGLERKKKRSSNFLSPSPGKLLYDAHLLLSAGFVEELKKAGYQLSIDAWAVLNVLWTKDNLPQFEISTLINRDRHQTSRLIDTLCQQGLVSRQLIDGDHRVKRIVLTDLGKSVQIDLKNVANEYLEKTFIGVTKDEYAGFIKCLRHIANKHSKAREH